MKEVIDGGQVRDELPENLIIPGTLEFLKPDFDAGLLEGRLVHVARSPRAGQVGVGLQGPARLDETPVRVLRQRKLRSQTQRRPDAPQLQKGPDDPEVERPKPFPPPRVLPDKRDRRHHLIKVRGPGVGGPEGFPVFASPGGAAVDAHLANPLGKPVGHRNGHPLPALGRFDPVAVLPFVLLVLNVIEDQKHVGALDLVQIPQPGKVLGLVGREDHGVGPLRAAAEYFTKTGLVKIRAPDGPQTSSR